MVECSTGISQIVDCSNGDFTTGRVLNGDSHMVEFSMGITGMCVSSYIKIFFLIQNILISLTRNSKRHGEKRLRRKTHSQVS